MASHTSLLSNFSFGFPLPQKKRTSGGEGKGGGGKGRGMPDAKKWGGGVEGTLAAVELA
jgi:hypothetical protein